ncbi:hypothetical protein [Agromyces laixinhei]|uniref:hypothetical protein n=1 Tax=Agromyces laixinhei TaxID=2585717 RepID=UPI001115C718|nr:hypothetical protein [Agromyces laixinhei]
MTNPTESTTSRRPLPWLLILGLSSLSLLWPLTALTGIAGEGAPRAFLILGIIAVVWVGTVGLGRVPHPILTLTLTGVTSGFIALVLAGIVPGGGGPFGGTGTLWSIIPALAIDAALGAIAGLAAAGMQRLAALVRAGGDR